MKEFDLIGLGNSLVDILLELTDEARFFHAVAWRLAPLAKPKRSSWRSPTASPAGVAILTMTN